MKNPKLLMAVLSSLIFTPFQSFAQEGAGAQAQSLMGYVGTYTKKEGHVDGQAKGIYTVFQNPENGALELGGLEAEIVNPSFVKLSPDGKYLYSVSELGPGDASSGFVYSFRVLADGGLEEISKVPSIGFAPCNLEVDATGEYVFVSNYLGGIVVMYQRDPQGALIEKQVLRMENEAQSHPHSVTLSEDNSFAYIADLGNDKIWIYHFDPEKGILEPHSQAFVALEKGAGPRHFDFSKDGRYAFSMNELNSTVSSFQVQEDGGLKLVQTISSLPKDFEGKNSGADIHVHNSGNYLYVSNRGHNSIAGFGIDTATGKLTSLGYFDTLGKTPRNFAIGPEGDFLYVANQDSNTIGLFKIEGATGKLQEHLEPLRVKTPVCIEFKE